jgi:5'-3' exonuclease
MLPSVVRLIAGLSCRIDSFGLEDFAAHYEGLRVDQFVDMQALMDDQADKHSRGVWNRVENSAQAAKTVW